MIEVDNLNFSYDKKNNTLENVNFKIQGGICILSFRRKWDRKNHSF